MDVLTDISDVLLSVAWPELAGTGQDNDDTRPPGHDGDISADTPRSEGHCRPGDRHCRLQTLPLTPADCLTPRQRCRPPGSRHCHP